jgi:hypothetical protein
VAGFFLSDPEPGFISFGLIAGSEMVLGYVLSAIWKNRPFSEMFMAFLISLNALANSGIWYLITGNEIASFAVLILLLPAILPRMAASASYQAILGYANPFLPMSWPVLAPGLLFFLVNVAASSLSRLLGLKKFGTKISRVPEVGTWVQEGGLIHPLRGYYGFNMGNFVFVNPDRSHVIRHECGHTLSLAVFGFFFHYAGAIDENYIQSKPSEAVAEWVAESYARPFNSFWSLWGKPENVEDKS